jgi:sugar fermentation stimulation protein A
MRFAAPLVRATLIQRYKRFLADVRLDDGREVTAHCANPGSMMGLKAPGSTVWLSPAGPGRKLPFGLELIEADGGLVAINTGNPNHLAEEAIGAGLVPGVDATYALRREVRYGTENSRIDLLATAPDGTRTWIEVKNCHLMRTPGLAEFPDSVTERGAKHLRELGRRVEEGERALLLFVVQRGDCSRLAFAQDLDPRYAEAARAAAAAGVAFAALTCHVTLEAITPAGLMPVDV